MTHSFDNQKHTKSRNDFYAILVKLYIFFRLFKLQQKNGRRLFESTTEHWI